VPVPTLEGDVTTNAVASGLRERKKAKTRELIIKVATQLFIKHGFDEVTLERVGMECEVSVRTVLRYFETKEAVALAHQVDMLDRFREGMASRSGDALSYWRDHVATSAAISTTRPGQLNAHLRMVMDHPVLAARYAALRHEYEDLLADAFAEETGDRGLGPRLLAAMLVAGNHAVTRHWLASHEPYDPTEHIAVVDYAAEALGQLMPASPAQG
jgi:AcrR family transcriptional regulator